MIDTNLLSPEFLSTLTKRPIEIVLGEKEVERLENIRYNYDYYSGKQHKDEWDRLVRAYELERPADYDYDPTRFETNYFKAFVKRKARWQMAGQHGIEVLPKSDDSNDVEKAQAYEELLHQIWEENKMESKKIGLARDRLIGGKIACKIAYNKRTGRLHWIWHTADEVFPLYSDDGFNDLIGYDIIVPIDDPNNSNRTHYSAQHFRINENNGECYLEEVVYNESMKVVRTIQKKHSLGIKFVPVISFDIESLQKEEEYFDDLKDIELLTTQLNNMMEDATDSLKFEMFGITVVRNAKEGTARQLQMAPGAVVEITSNVEGVAADMKVLENGFQWKEAYKDQYNRIKSALHELSGLPQIVPQELNFGGMNDRALQVLYQDIIQETGEHWLSWDSSFKELFEGTLQYLKARVNSPTFSYDKEVVQQTEDLKTRMNFILPLPDDRENLIELLQKEMDSDLESTRGAMKRAGVVDADKKLQEIREERRAMREAEEVYDRSSEVEYINQMNQEAESSEGDTDIVDTERSPSE